MTGYRVDNSRRITLPEAIPGEVYDVEMVAPGHYVAKRQWGKHQTPNPKHQIEGLEEKRCGLCGRHYTLCFCHEHEED